MDRSEGEIIERVDLETLKPLLSYPYPINSEVPHDQNGDTV
ncbi:hypothetical protein [Paenibacillus xylanivorans]|nr:hypothetical protein [Paenibacillus xylanivorans]